MQGRTRRLRKEVEKNKAVTQMKTKLEGEKGSRVTAENTVRDAKDRNVKCKLNEIELRSLKGLERK